VVDGAFFTKAVKAALPRQAWKDEFRTYANQATKRLIQSDEVVDDLNKISKHANNIFQERVFSELKKGVSSDLDSIFMPSSGNLESWAKQGVLLLNASLTVRKDNPNSHKHLKWNLFTDAVIQKISEEKENVVFMLWGSFAQKKGLKVDTSKHLVLQSGHPSPMSANQGKWFGNKHFSQANLYLDKNNLEPIQWII